MKNTYVGDFYSLFFSSGRSSDLLSESASVSSALSSECNNYNDNDSVAHEGSSIKAGSNRLSTGSEKSIFDEKAEWTKISEIIDSFGVDIGADVKESTTPNNCESGCIF